MSTILTIGKPASGTINGATNGSIITVTGAPAGFTINSAARTWAYNGAGSGSASVSVTFTETLDIATNNPKVSVIAVDVAIAGVFTANPTILGASTRNVNDVFAYTVGSVSDGTIGLTYLYKDGTRYKTLTTGSDIFDVGGSYFVRTYIANTNVYADSNAVNAVIAATAPITPPMFYFAQDRVAGKNPPEVFWDDVDDTVFATDVLEVEYVNGSTTYTKEFNLDIASRSLHEFLVSEWDNLSAGLFSIRGRYRRTKDIDGNTIPLVISAWSSVLSDTLSAKTLPPAVTIWDIQNKSSYINVNNTDYLTAQGQNVGAAQPILTNISRNDKRFAEYKIVNYDPDSGFDIGISPADGIAESFSTPANSVKTFVNATDHTLNDVFTLLITPKVGSTNGQLIIRKNGTQIYTAVNALDSYKLLFSPNKQAGVRLNTGKEAFSYAPTDTSYIRYN